uniref:THAP domain-containing protein 6-like n=1 Tax=Crassostrea virginica TaxID=6565 RepID=A0A8B8BW85_CRAVI|nr:THAP domain-containing protein 6-like [Crassostrea virginica]
MVRYCCVPGCGRFNGHRFPKDKNLHLQWRVAIRRVDPKTKKLWYPGKEDVVCHFHFRESDYRKTESGQRCLLMPAAVPSIFEFNASKNGTEEVETHRSKKLKTRTEQQGKSEQLSEHCFTEMDIPVQEDITIGCNENQLTEPKESQPEPLMTSCE